MLHNYIYEFYTCVSILFIAITVMGELITFKFEKMLITEIKRKQIGAISTVIQIKKTFNKLTRNLATESAESNAPPCAPPSNDSTRFTRFTAIENVIEAILPALLDQLSTDENTDKELANALRFSSVRKYIIYRISKKILDHYDKLPLNLTTIKGFYEFEKNVRAEIVQRLSRTIEIAHEKAKKAHAKAKKARPAKAKKARPILKDAVEDYYRQDINLDEEIGNIKYDGTQRNYYDIIQNKKAENPLLILIEKEAQAQEQVILSKLTEEQKQQLIKEYDGEQRQKKCLLFDESESEYYSENQETIDIFKYRHRKRTPHPTQLEIDFTKGGDENE